jgi:2-keto-4-pentenoate hydratase/2-oxohepta-3-ene-1,7-dioic acid hydratase in catechol pathway
MKPPSSLIAHGDSIVYPALSQRVDFEGELGVIIGRRARHVKRENAFDYVHGYTIVNDVTARERQKKYRQRFLGKALDTFCPMGPRVTTADEVTADDLQLNPS